jgi:hypothetical protein
MKSSWTDSEQKIVQTILMEVKLDSLFYLAVSSEHGVQWYQVITLKSGCAMTELQFSKETFQIVEDYNLNGLTIYSLSITWAPYLSLEDCDKSGENCKTYGYLKDYTDIIAKRCNFTWESHKEINEDWGVLPKSGARFTNC